MRVAGDLSEKRSSFRFRPLSVSSRRDERIRFMYAQNIMFTAIHDYLGLFPDKESLLGAAVNLTDRIHTAANYSAELRMRYITVLEEHCKYQRRLVIIDEAGKCPAHIMEMLQSVNERCNLPILLVEEKGLKAKIDQVLWLTISTSDSRFSSGFSLDPAGV